MYKYLIFLLAIVGLASCTQTEPTPTVSPTIEYIGWVIGNIPSNYWSDGLGPTAVIDLSLRFQDIAIEVADIKSVIITNSLAPEYQWSYETSDLTKIFSGTKKKWLEFNGLWTPNIASNASVIYLGTYTIKVELNNGQIATKNLVTPAPNSLNADGYSYTYSSESYIGIPPSNYVALPKQASIQSATLNAAGDTLSIDFFVDDNKIYSGWVWFYNKDGKALETV